MPIIFKAQNRNQSKIAMENSLTALNHLTNKTCIEYLFILWKHIIKKTVYNNVYRKRRKKLLHKTKQNELYMHIYILQICVAISIVYVIVSITCKLQMDRNIYKINKLESVKRGKIIKTTTTTAAYSFLSGIFSYLEILTKRNEH